MALPRPLSMALAGVLLCATTPALAKMTTRNVEWSEGAATFQGVLVFDDTGKNKRRPGLVMVPNWMGVNASAVEKARGLAGKDYVVLVADVWGKGQQPKDQAQAGAKAKALRDDRPLLRTRANAALAALKAQAGRAPLDASRIAAVGFCFGGSTVLEYVRGGTALAGAISLHGGLATPMPAKAKSARTPVLVLNGADDAGIAKADIASFETEMNAAGADWQFVNFSGAVHCFAEADANRPPGCVYHERSAKRAYEMLHDFLRERFAAK